MSTVIGYCRVSTTEQGESGAGLAAQKAAIQAEVGRRGWDFATMFADVGSGKSMKRRDDLARALEVLASGEAEILVVAKLDRLSRSLLDFAGLMATAREQDWSIVALDLGVDTTTPNGKLVANIIMAMAEWERELIGARTKDALAEVRARGVRLGRPRGVSEDTAAMIRVLRQQGLGYHKIANMLNEQHVPTGQGGAKWWASTVQAVESRDPAAGVALTSGHAAEGPA